ncbi:hypothetical protein [Rhodococcus sp. NPDC076796]|uniref:hypothetical protein n=1 Tax=Rhodococcus sp. NPDC076796 TaxID=3154859 RepID=UPI00344B1DF7
MHKQPYGVVLNDLRLPLDSSHSLGEGWELRRASAEQIAQIRPVIAGLYNACMLSETPTPPPQEYLITGTAAACRFDPLPPEQWRYWTVHRGEGPGLHTVGFVEALALSDAELFVDYWPNGEPDNAIPGRHKRIARPTAMTTFVHDSLAWEGPPPTVDLDEIRELVSLRTGLYEKAQPEIWRMLQLFTETSDLPERSKQKFLAYLAIIEGLLTHQPAPGDRVDSIGKQLRRNITLLDNRLPPHRKLELDKFGGTNPNKVIDKLYNYRSAIAHGGNPEDVLDVIFEKRWPQPLTVLELHRFARRITKRLLIAALREPILVRDLKG